MKKFALLLSVVCITACHGYLFSWFEQIPLLEDDDDDGISEADQSIKTILDKMKSSASMAITNGMQYHISFTSGKNCGRQGKNEAIYVPAFDVSDPIVLGGNVTVSGEVRVKRKIESLSLMSVVVVKDGVGEIPCTGDIGSCNYTNPCEKLKKVTCPKQIVKQGWDCRCPLAAKWLKFPESTYTVPTIPLPAFLIVGKYHTKVQLFAGDQEVFCATFFENSGILGQHSLIAAHG